MKNIIHMIIVLLHAIDLILDLQCFMQDHCELLYYEPLVQTLNYVANLISELTLSDVTMLNFIGNFSLWH